MTPVNEPLVSVVIPLFNKENYIEATLQSVVNQTYGEIELIIIDDSSTDKSYQLAEAFLQSRSQRFRDIKIRSRGNTGQAGARNDGIASAEGEFVAFLDADDVWHPEKLYKQVQYLMLHKDKNLVFCNYFMLFENSSKVKAVNLSPIQKKVDSWLLTVGYGGLLESTGLARRTSLLEMGGFESNLQMCGGLDLAFRFKGKTTAGSVNDYLCGYRVTKGGWHNNKSDLINSYDLLLEKRGLYCDYESKVRKCLQIHLSIWSFRNSSTPNNALTLTLQFLRNPILFSSYVFSTTSRVLFATIRGVMLRRDALFIREMMG
jgi:glycosyltransferase involved in cell wall biosynthesis